MRRITTDLAASTVTLRKGETCSPLPKQWLAFYLALALRADAKASPLFLDAQELRLYRPWSHKKPGSVGKEVARHLGELARWGMSDFIESPERTKRWRLALSPEEVVFHPSREACELWLKEQQVDISEGVEPLPATFVDWLTHATRTLLLLVRGEIQRGLACVRAAKKQHGGSALLGAIAEVIEIRLLARVQEYPEIGEVGPNLSGLQGSVGKALLARAELAQALAPTPDGADREAAIDRLRGLAVRLENHPDLNGLGIAHNALGVLLRRAGRLDEAKSCLRYAAALLVASSDLHALQAALFNLGHAVHAGARSPEDRREALKLIALDREIDAELNIGRDSAQAEIVAGMICLELGEWEPASEWLRKGQAIEETVDSPYDRGGLAELEARLLWCRAWREKGRLEPGAVREVLRLYGEAEELLLAAGDVPAYLKDEVKAVKRGEAPRWLAGRGAGADG